MKCSGCGKEIDWAWTLKGKKMPVLPNRVRVVPSKHGRTTIILDSGAVVRGEESPESDLGLVPWVEGRPLHWIDCPAAERFRKGNR